ncbi:MAG: 50S ribosomal protein L19 [Candidatus Omnitrophota bacterium]|nr:50S ribosomal protein L19 [Candidatus Omnitrophota bacterium]
MSKVTLLEQAQLRTDLPKINIGDHVKVYVKIPEGDKIRLHPFEGTVIAKKGSGLRLTITVRKVSFGEGVEKVFIVHSPSIKNIEVAGSVKVKRAKLYYLRKKVGRKATL